MNSILSLIGTDSILATQLTRKLTIDGITCAYPVYRIKLDLLYYNDQNDRIATWISQYKNNHMDQALNTLDRIAYNAVIEEFIIQSNPGAIEKTQLNIELVDQREPGVVLLDGRIIDGNRRYTCLRRLSLSNPRFNYFEAVILELDVHRNPKQIKMLELTIQHGEEKKVDYNSIDKLVGVYQDIVESRLLSIEEYALSANESIAEIRKKVDQSQLMMEFLEFIKMPRQFHVARDYQLASVIVDLHDLIRRCQGSDTKQRVKKAVFTNIMMKTTRDSRRFIREIAGILGTSFLNIFLNEQEKASSQIDELLFTTEFDTAKDLDAFVQGNEEFADDLIVAYDKAMLKAKRAETKEKPTQIVSKSISLLKDVDINIITKLNASEKDRLKNQLTKLSSLVETFDTFVDNDSTADLSQPNKIQESEDILSKSVQTNRYFIAAPDWTAGIITCTNHKTITNSIFHVEFKLNPFSQNAFISALFTAFFISDDGTKISNNQTLSFTKPHEHLEPNPIRLEFTLNLITTGSKTCFLALKNPALPDNELLQLIPFRVQISFSTEFSF